MILRLGACRRFEVRSFPPEALGGLKREERADGSGNLIFNEVLYSPALVNWLGFHDVSPEGAVEGGEGRAQEIETGGEVADAGGSVGAQSHTLRSAAIFSRSARAPAAVTSPPAP